MAHHCSAIFASHRPVGNFNLRENQSDFKEKIAYQAA